MKFVLMFWCNVWVCEFDVDWVVDELLMNSWLVVVVVVVMRCCCWWLMSWVIIIIELEVNLCCSWRFSWKMDQMVIFVELMFWFKFYMELSVFSCFETFKQTLGSNLGIEKWKLGFLGEKWWKTCKNRRKLAWSLLMASSLWKELAYG